MFIVGGSLLTVRPYISSFLQAGLRTLHDAGPELKRAISGNLEEMMEDNQEPSHRVSTNTFVKLFSDM